MSHLMVCMGERVIKWIDILESIKGNENVSFEENCPEMSILVIKILISEHMANCSEIYKLIMCENESLLFTNTFATS
jgi:hypothetical protein